MAKRVVFFWVVVGLFLTGSVAVAQTLTDAEEVVSTAAPEVLASDAEIQGEVNDFGTVTVGCLYPDVCEPAPICTVSDTFSAWEVDLVANGEMTVQSIVNLEHFGCPGASFSLYGALYEGNPLVNQLGVVGTCRFDEVAGWTTDWSGAGIEYDVVVPGSVLLSGSAEAPDLTNADCTRLASSL